MVAAGRVVQLNVSGGGVPKLPVPEIEVLADGTGVVGDVQKERKHHGRPWQALCLWSVEVIDDLAAEGHPIAAGAAGENVTIEGLDWTAVRPGVQVRIGATVRCEITAAAVPCKKLKPWFTDGDWLRIDDDRHPGRARMYAVVHEGGLIRPGDAVEMTGEVDPSPLRTSAELDARWGGR